LDVSFHLDVSFALHHRSQAAAQLLCSLCPFFSAEGRIQKGWNQPMVVNGVELNGIGRSCQLSFENFSTDSPLDTPGEIRLTMDVLIFAHAAA
jgi:hypothetical protein